MIYELREYVAEPGRSAELHARFRDHTFTLFGRHAITVVGYWTPDGDADRIIYLVRFVDETARQEAWDSFQADPEWQRVKADSEARGAIVAQMSSRVLTSPPYWTATTTAGNAG